MRRRDLLLAMGGAAFSPLATRAQQHGERKRRIAMLQARTPSSQTYQAAFLQALGNLGWIVDYNLTMEHRWVVADAERLRIDAAELVALKPEVILSDTSPSVAALRRATHTVPVVVARLTDPLGQGFIAIPARPGGNVTGFTDFEPAFAGKWVDLLKEIAPDITRIALLHNPQTALFSTYFLPPFGTAARRNGIEPIAAPVRDVAELDALIAAEGRESGGAFVAQADTFVSLHRERIVAAALRHRLPAYTPANHMRAPAA